MASTIVMRFIRETPRYALYEGKLPNGKTWYCYTPKPLVFSGLISTAMWPEKIEMYVGVRGAADPQPHKSQKSARKYTVGARRAVARNVNKAKKRKAAK